MKNAIMSLAIALFTIGGIQAQVNKSVKKESTTKRVVIKDGKDVKTVETKDVDTESGGLIIENNNKIDRNYNEVTNKDTNKNILVDEVSMDSENDEMVNQNKKEQVKMLETSRRNQEELAAEKKIELQQKQDQLNKDLMERKAQLEARPKGMSKLKTD